MSKDAASIRNDQSDFGNLFHQVPNALSEELFEVLQQTPEVRIERIVSTGQSSPEGFWYDSAEHEWVVLLSGAAQLRIEGERQARSLQPGDYVFLPAHRRHRVESTSSEKPTVWLAIFFKSLAPLQSLPFA